ncbi:MAG: histidine phosphotransferase family protein, partial [Arenibacterium sp.]
MSDSTVNLATLIGSRICHDLISPVGAITNGLELLEMSGSMDGPELELISDSVQNAGARIRFFRIAYGMASDQMLGRLEVTSVLKDISAGGRLRFDWRPDAPHPRALVRLAFLALQCCETAMPYGGGVRIYNFGERWDIKRTNNKMKMGVLLLRGALSDFHREGVSTPSGRVCLFSSVAHPSARDHQTWYGNTTARPSV